MRTVFFIFLIGISLAFFSACNDVRNEPVVPLTKEQLIRKNIDSLKAIAQEGDLIVRAGDDLLSEQIKFMNEVDQTYSHSGLIIERNMQKMVCHIAPDSFPADTIQYIPIDSFLNTSKNLKCALYRYKIPKAEIDSVKAMLYRLGDEGVRFDRKYDIRTSDRLYCSEMIARCLEYASNNRIQIRLNGPKKHMLKMLVHYFKKENISEKEILDRQVISIDNLYRRPDCELIMEFPLKYFPGQ